MVIQGLGNNSPFDTGVIEGAASAELRHLQVKSTSGDQYAVGIYVPPGDTRIRNVTIVASGSLGSWGIRAGGGSPWVEEVTIRAQGGSNVYGLVGSGTGSRPVIKRTVIEATNGSSAGYGMFFGSGSAPVEARDVQIRLTGGGTSAYGIYIDEESFQLITRITDSTVDVGGATTTRGIRFRGLRLNVEQSQVRATGGNSVGVDTVNGETVIDHSEIAGTLSTVNSSAFGYNTRVGASRLEGGAVVAAFPICAGVYDETFTFFALRSRSPPHPASSPWVWCARTRHSPCTCSGADGPLSSARPRTCACGRICQAQRAGRGSTSPAILRPGGSREPRPRELSQLWGELSRPFRPR